MLVCPDCALFGKCSFTLTLLSTDTLENFDLPLVKIRGWGGGGGDRERQRETETAERQKNEDTEADGERY